MQWRKDEAMAIQDILLYRNHEVALRRKSKPVRKLNRSIKRLVEDLKDTLMAHPEGIGLASPQVNAHHRVVVVRLGAGIGGKRRAWSAHCLNHSGKH